MIEQISWHHACYHMCAHRHAYPACLLLTHRERRKVVDGRESLGDWLGVCAHRPAWATQ